MPHFPTRLRFVASEDRYSIYVDADDNEVYLAHGTAARLVTISDLDIPALYRVTYSTGWTFRQEIEDMLIDPDEADEIMFCEHCGDPEHERDTDYWSSLDDGMVCEHCYDHHYFTCEDCEEVKPDSDHNSVDGRAVCDRCLRNNYYFCDECDVYYGEYDEGHHHDDECGCESPRQRFSMRFVSDGSDTGRLDNDDMTTVTLPAGEISDEGIGDIARLLRNQYYDDTLDLEARKTFHTLSYQLDQIGSTWQTKQGNFTKRLSRYAYKTFGLKISPAVLSKVGNLASQHSAAVDFQITITRDLNQSAEDFGHEDSCYWGSYSSSRCTLKNSGGIGLRTWGQGYYGRTVAGRAWVQPLKFDQHGDLVPTFDAETPAAYVVFNGYGNLSGYAPARLVASMTGWTYRKVVFSCGEAYINGDSGYLVAPEDVAEPFTDGRVSLYPDPHSNLHQRELTERLDAAREAMAVAGV